MSCVPTRDICLTHGKSLAFSIGLHDRDDIAAATGDWTLTMTFWDADDPSANALLVLTGVWRLPDSTPTEPDGISVYADITGTAAQMATLPTWDHHYSVDLANVAGTIDTRLYQGKVAIT